MLWGKIWILIELALNATYSRVVNDKKWNNSKSYVNSYEALFRQEKEIITENLDLNKELLTFILNADSDRSEAQIYLSLEDTMRQYGFDSFINIPSSEPKASEVWKIQLNDYHYEQVMRNIKSYRTNLLSEIQKEGDALTGYTILSSQEELYKIIEKMHLHRNGTFIDAKITHYARYFFKKLCDESRDIMAEKLIMDFDASNESKENGKQKHDKKKGKNKRRRKNKNDSSNASKNKHSIKQDANKDEPISPQEDSAKKSNGKQTSSCKNKQKSIYLELEEEKIACVTPSKPECQNLSSDEKSIKMDFETSQLNHLIHSISLYQETKSEHGKEDPNKLEHDFEKKRCLNEYQWSKDPIKQNQMFKNVEDKRKGLNKQSSKSLLSSNEWAKLKNVRTRYDSDAASPFRTPSHEDENYLDMSEVECAILENLWKDFKLSHPPEILSIESEEKYELKWSVVNKTTNPTSESSSIKCSSVTSKENAKNIVQNVSTPECQTEEWITSTNKKARNNKNKNWGKGNQGSKRKTKNNAKRSKK